MEHTLPTELVTPLWIAEDAEQRLINERRIQLYRIDRSSGRNYYTVHPDGIRFYTSWTTMIKQIVGTSEHLVKWIADTGYEASRKHMEERAHYGTVMHIIIGDFLTKGTFDLDRCRTACTTYLIKQGMDPMITRRWERDLQSDLLSFAQFCADKDVRPLAIEMPLIYTGRTDDCAENEPGPYAIAGTIDLVCELTFNKKRVRAIVDFKSGRKGFYQEHRYQLHGYARMWDENFPELPIEMCFNWSPKDWNKAPSYNFENQTEANERYSIFYLLGTHRCNFADAKPAPVRHYEGQVVLGEAPTGCYAAIELEDILKGKHGINTDADTNAAVVAEHPTVP